MNKETESFIIATNLTWSNSTALTKPSNLISSCSGWYVSENASQEKFIFFSFVGRVKLVRFKKYNQKKWLIFIKNGIKEI